MADFFSGVLRLWRGALIFLICVIIISLNKKTTTKTFENRRATYSSRTTPWYFSGWAFVGVTSDLLGWTICFVRRWTRRSTPSLESFGSCFTTRSMLKMRLSGIYFICRFKRTGWKKDDYRVIRVRFSYRFATISSGYSDVERPRTFQSRSARSGIVPVAFKPRSMSSSPRRSSDSVIRESIDSRASKFMSLIFLLFDRNSVKDCN